jgi:hypothetical protein
MLAICSPEHAIAACSDVSITIMSMTGSALVSLTETEKGGANAMLNDDINLRRRVFSDVFDLNFHCPKDFSQGLGETCLVQLAA